MGILDIILGRDENGNVSKINLALIALMLWRMYQGSGRSGQAPAPQPVPAPTPGRAEIPTREAPQIPAPRDSAPSGSADGGFGDLIDAMKRMPEHRREPGGGGPGGGLGDILGDILGGGRPGGRGAPERGPGGGGLDDILGDILGGGRSGRTGQPGGGGLGDILGDILGGGRPGGMRAAAAGPQGDPFADLLRGGGSGMLGGLLGAGLGGLLQQFDQSGHGDQARSWVSAGGNAPLSAADIEDTFGADMIDALAQRLDMPREDLLAGLAQALPETVDRLTPEGRMPTPEEWSRGA